MINNINTTRKIQSDICILHRGNPVDTSLLRWHSSKVGGDADTSNSVPSSFFNYDGRVISNFVVQALKGEPITIYGSGSQTRSFCYVDDMIEALVKFMDTPKDLCGPVNLGNPSEITILKLANEIIRMTGSSSTIHYKDLPSDDPIKRKPDISLAKTHLRWKPETKLQKGLSNTIRYFKTLL